MLAADVGGRLHLIWIEVFEDGRQVVMIDTLERARKFTAGTA
jgi:hypothetical protein